VTVVVMASTLIDSVRIATVGYRKVRRLRPKERVKSASALRPFAHCPANRGELRTVCQILDRPAPQPLYAYSFQAAPSLSFSRPSKVCVRAYGAN